MLLDYHLLQLSLVRNRESGENGLYAAKCASFQEQGYPIRTWIPKGAQARRQQEYQTVEGQKVQCFYKHDDILTTETAV